MIVRTFLNWYRSPSVEVRMEAVAAMAEAFLNDQLGGDSLKDAEAALMLVLDDSAISVRRMLAWTLAASQQAPRPLMVALAHDQPQVATLVLARSPQIKDADLIDCLGAGTTLTHLAIALRSDVSAPVAAALAARAGSEALVALCGNPRASIAPETFGIMLERWPKDAALREALAARDDLPATVRQSLVQSLAEDLAGLAGLMGWLDAGRATRIAKDSTETATIALAATAPDLGAFVEHLRANAQLTPSLLLRTLMCGDIALFGAAMVSLAGLAPSRVAGILHGRGGAPLRALCDKAGLAPALVPAIAASLAEIRNRPALADARTPRLDRRIIAAALSASLGVDETSVRPLLALLRRLDAEAAREDARRITDEITAADAPLLVDEAAQEIDPDADEELQIEALEAGSEILESAFEPGEDFAEAQPVIEDVTVAEVLAEAVPPPDLAAALPADEAAQEPSPALARLLRLQQRLAVSIVETAPVEPLALPLADNQPVLETSILAAPVQPAPAPARPTNPDEAYRADLDDLFAATFGETEDGADDVEDAPSADALNIVESLHKALDESFFNNWDIRRRAA